MPTDVEALGRRQGWPAELLFLRDRHPRAGWNGARLGDLAEFWLAKHASLRALGARIAAAGTDWREGRLDIDAFHAGFAPPLQRFLGDLDGHHHVEDSHYFPIFRQAESRLARGFDVLENDHGLIHARITATVEAARAFLAAPGPDSGAAYVAACAPLIGSLDAHLTDEEDLVIPLLADRMG